jgi:hypothetical protein
MIYSECVAVALVFQRAKWMRRIILSPVASPAVPYFSTFSHKWGDFRGKKYMEDKISDTITKAHIAHFRQQCHNSKFVIFQEKILTVFKCYIFL